MRIAGGNLSFVSLLMVPAETGGEELNSWGAVFLGAVEEVKSS